MALKSLLKCRQPGERVLVKSQTNSGSFRAGEHRWHLKVCQGCGAEFTANTGSKKWCETCRASKQICPECSGVKSEYHYFCGLSCAGKWKYRHSVTVRAALLSGVYDPKRGSNQALAHRGTPHLSLRGERNPNWHGGGCRSARQVLMGRGEYANWRRAVFARDDFTCQTCKVRGGRLNADHIVPYALRPDLALEISNGLTLCESCHRKTPTWGQGTRNMLNGVA